MNRRSFLAALLALATAPAIAATATARTPAAEIEALIQRVAAARAVIVIRNGSEYPAADAAKHMRR